MLDDGADHGLREAGVDVVVRNLVAVIGAPAVGLLAEVLGADVEAVHLVGDVEEHHRALARLGVLKDDAVVVKVVAYRLEVLLHALAYRDNAQLRAQALGNRDGVVLRAVGGAEAGHGDGDDVAPRQAAYIHRAGAGEHDERGVHAAGDAYDGPPAVRVPHALDEAGGLDGEAALGELGDTGIGHEGLALYAAGELGLGALEAPGAAGDGCALHSGIGLLAYTRVVEVEDVKLAHGHAAAVLADGEGFTVVHHGAEAVVALVGAALAAGRGRADAAVVQAPGVHLEGGHGAAPGLHAHRLVAQLGDNGGPGSTEGRGGRHGEPVVGGKLHAHGQAVENVVSAVDSLALQVGVVRVVEVYLHDLARVKRREHGAAHIPARREAEDFTVAHEGGGTVQCPARGEGQADDDEHIAALGGHGDALEALHRGVGQKALEVEVAAGAARERELREAEELYSPGLRVLDALDDFPGVEFRVRHTQLGGCGRGLEKSVLHYFITFVYLISLSNLINSRTSRRNRRPARLWAGAPAACCRARGR